MLEPDGIARGTYLITTPTSDIGFNCSSPHWLDVEVFEESVGHVLGQPVDGLRAAAIVELEDALELYTSELLEGFYDDWALRERERLRMLYLNSLAYLMRYCRHHGAIEQSLACAQQILQHDPLREEIHREMMRLYAEHGQRALAVRQYETCCEILATELGVPPMEETRALYAQIVPEASCRLPGSTTPGEPTALHQLLRQLRLTAQDFGTAHEQLRQAIQLLERLAK
ncbi:MAG: bacterial transcriptional activator domain-containing protein [Anaerolineae bacterium]|nr:bacterial transcriptional activator domain-containing protein [Anaerolineae bacterium]